MSPETAAAAAAWFSQALGQPCRLVRAQAGSRHSVRGPAERAQQPPGEQGSLGELTSCDQLGRGAACRACCACCTCTQGWWWPAALRAAACLHACLAAWQLQHSRWHRAAGACQTSCTCQAATLERPQALQLRASPHGHQGRPAGAAVLKQVLALQASRTRVSS